MTSIKELTVFSVGDSRKLSSWSNVPYFFTETLLSKGIRVNRVNLERSFLGKALNKTVWALVNLVNRNNYYGYSRSLVHYLSVRLKIKRALARYVTSDANIFLTFSFSSVGLTNQPTVLFCDWTYDHHFRYFLRQQPNAMESMAIAREDRQIEAADLVLVLFPRVAEYMKERYRNPRIFYLGNVVNTLLDMPKDQVLARKAQSQQLLFIGGSKYLAGARHLVDAYAVLKREHPGLVLDIVGIRGSELGDLPPGVRCHGYLDKDDSEQRAMYYDLLMRARVLVNTTPKWGAFSATLEAMHWYTPVVTTPYPDFIETFSTDIDFGRYCNGESVEETASTIATLLAEPDYAALCERAHGAVKEYTWSAYIDKVLQRIEQVMTERARVSTTRAEVA